MQRGVGKKTYLHYVKRRFEEMWFVEGSERAGKGLCWKLPVSSYLHLKNVDSNM